MKQTLKDKIYWLLQKLKSGWNIFTKLNIWFFIKYNYFCRHIKRAKGVYIFPRGRAILEFGKGSQLLIEESLYLGHNLLKGSRAETLIRLRKNARLHVKHTTYIYYNVTIDVFDNGQLEIGSAEINCGSSIMCKEHVHIGEDVLIARGVFIFDSDFHQTYWEETGSLIPLSNEVWIGDHSWICIKASLLKGARIENYGIVAAHKKIQDATVAAAPIRRR